MRGLDVCVGVRVNSKPFCNVLFTCCHWFSLTILACFFSVFFCRARQKHITKETAMPGESKALRPLRVVLRRGTSLILYPPPLPHLRLEPLALPQIAIPAKRVRVENTHGSKNTKNAYVSFVVEIIISIHAGCVEAYRFAGKWSGKCARITKT